MENISNLLTHIKNKMRLVVHRRNKSKEYSKGLNFQGSEENYIRNGACLLEDSISLFHGKTNPLRQFSADDLNNMNVNQQVYFGGSSYMFYQGSFDGRDVLIDRPDFCNSSSNEVSHETLRELVVATQMVIHSNVHKLVGCCIETKNPVLIYEWVEAKSLEDYFRVQSDEFLEWKDRLRIAWEISHVVAYLHTAFPRPIIHRDLKPSNILLDENNSAKLRDFSLSISLPEGEEFVETSDVIGTMGYCAPEYLNTGKLSESADVYSLGVLLLVLLTGKQAFSGQREPTTVVDWVRNGVKDKDNIITEIVDPGITRNGATTVEDLQLRASIQLALLCCAADADSRPTIVEVATELRNMIRSPESIPTISNFQVPT